MPPTNPGRRRALADAAIDLLAASGVHGVTHRAVEKTAGLPQGTASNYFRSREALLVAAAERIVELHRADTERAAQDHEPAADRAAGPPPHSAGQGAGAPAHSTGQIADEPAAFGRQLADLLAESLFGAATAFRNRYLAIFELQMEAVRRPALAAALAGLQDASTRFTAGQHAQLGFPTPAEAIPALIALYGGALFTLVTAPPGSITREVVRGVAHAIVHGALAGPDGAPRGGPEPASHGGPEPAPHGGPDSAPHRGPDSR